MTANDRFWVTFSTETVKAARPQTSAVTPIADSCTPAKDTGCNTSFDQLVGAGKQRGRHLKAKCLRGFEVDH
jgi:hypothetical protein